MEGKKSELPRDINVVSHGKEYKDFEKPEEISKTNERYEKHGDNLEGTSSPSSVCSVTECHNDENEKRKESLYGCKRMSSFSQFKLCKHEDGNNNECMYDFHKRKNIVSSSSQFESQNHEDEGNDESLYDNHKRIKVTSSTQVQSRNQDVGSNTESPYDSGKRMKDASTQIDPPLNFTNEVKAEMYVNKKARISKDFSTQCNVIFKANTECQTNISYPYEDLLFYFDPPTKYSVLWKTPYTIRRNPELLGTQMEPNKEEMSKMLNVRENQTLSQTSLTMDKATFQKSLTPKRCTILLVFPKSDHQVNKRSLAELQKCMTSRCMSRMIELCPYRFSETDVIFWIVPESICSLRYIKRVAHEVVPLLTSDPVFVTIYK